MARRSKSRSRSPIRKESHSHHHRSRHSSRERRDYFRSSDRNRKHTRDCSETNSPIHRSDRPGNSRRSAAESRRSRRSRSRSLRRFERSISPRRRRRSHSTSREKGIKGGAVPTFLLQRPEITAKDLEGKTEEEQEMMKLMGFGGFDSSKGKHVPGNDVSAVHVIHKRKYRQYMNRKGGFNRPLDFVA